MKGLFLSIIFLLSGIYLVEAQNCTFYFPTKTGTTLVTKSYNDKDKLTSTAKSTILELKGDKIKFSVEAYDGKDKLLSKGEYEVGCENGEFAVDMSSFMQGINKDAYKDMEVKMTTKSMSIPANLQAGQKLNDGEITMNVSNQGMTMMNMTTKITNRKVEAMEEISTVAGKFKCAKISYDVETKMMMLIHTKGIQWISQKIGVVRSESYDQKGKLLSYSVLSSLTE